MSIPQATSVLQGPVRSFINFCTNGMLNFNPIIYPSVVKMPCYTGSYSLDTCDTDILHTAIQKKLDNEIKDNYIRYYDHLIFILPKNYPCTFVGLGTMGPCNSTRRCAVWVNGDYADAPALYLHELGHNFGLGHANFEGNSYGDFSDVMGYCCSERCFNAVHSHSLGLTSHVKVIKSPFKSQLITLKPNEYVFIEGKQRLIVQNRQNERSEHIPTTFVGVNLYLKKEIDSYNVDDSILLNNLQVPGDSGTFDNFKVNYKQLLGDSSTVIQISESYHL